MSPNKTVVKQNKRKIHCFYTLTLTRDDRCGINNIREDLNLEFEPTEQLVIRTEQRRQSLFLLNSCLE